MSVIMTRLPGDAILNLDSAKSQAVSLSSNSSASTFMSPLTLPRGVSGYFDDFTMTNGTANSNNNKDNNNFAATSAGQWRNSNRSPQVYSPLSPGAQGPALQQQFLSPHILPYHLLYETQTRRSAAASPTLANAARRSMFSPPASNPGNESIAASALHGLPPPPPSDTSKSIIPPINAMSAAQSQTAPGDAPGASVHVQMIRRLVRQNGRIREAWEAERKYMEANRERVEEVYKEERALMEEERVEWDLEREALLRKIAVLEQQIAGLCGYSPKLTKNDVHAKRGGWDVPQDNTKNSASSQANRNASQRNERGESCSVGQPTSVQKNMTRNPVIAPDLEFAKHHISCLSSPHEQFESSPFFPKMDNRSSGSNHTTTNHHGIVSPPKSDDGAPVPIVDVQEIIPTSEGIPLKASALQKTTFSDGSGSASADSKSTSRSPSPPADPTKLGVSFKPTKVETLQLLAADETSRLIMNAGHTPNHSLSLVPTVTATTASSSGESTPTFVPVERIDSVASVSSNELAEPPTTVKGEGSGAETDSLADRTLDPEAVGDRPLKGPLMVRNMPAHDEVFFRKLSDKLEEVSKGAEAAVPTVLRDVAEPENQPTQDGDFTQHQFAGTDVAAADKSDTNGSSPQSNQGEEVDVPLKMKKSSNFGAPFGVFR